MKSETTIGERQAIAEAASELRAHEGEGSCVMCGTHGCCDCVPEPKCAACSPLATPTTNAPVAAQPIDMLLFCPKCGEQHIDEPAPVELGEEGRPIHWTNPPHRSHLCHGCGCIWRPADVATNGVASIATKGSADTWEQTALPIHGEMREALSEYGAACKKCPVNFPRENHVSPSKAQDTCSRCGNTASSNCGVESSASYAFVRAVRTLLLKDNSDAG